jgi:hypothetical protein
MKRTWIYFVAGLALLLSSGQVRALTEKTHTCNVLSVDLQMNGGPTANRLMVRCDAPATGVGGASIVFFAVNTGQDPERAKLALSLMESARVAGRPLAIVYHSDATSTTGFGIACNPADCRPIVRIVLL